MQLPANLEVAPVVVTTNAAPNTIDTGAAIAAPGLNFRLRLWSAHLSGLTQRTGRLWVSLETPASLVLANLGAAVGGSDEWQAPGGIVVPTNIALNARYMSDIASQSVRLFIYFTIEQA